MFMKKFLLIASLFIVLINTPITIFAQDDGITKENQECSTQVENAYLNDGPTFILIRNKNGEYECKDIEDIATENLVAPYDYTVDGVIEFAAFHLGFKFDGTLYFTIESDEPLKSVTGSAYVKSTSILNPITYYDKPFSIELYGSMATSRFLTQGISFNGNDSSVRVGFKNVVITAIGGDSVAMPNNSKVVKKR